MKILRIIRAWFLVLTFQKSNEAKRRFAICAKCDKITQGKLINTRSCGVCGCPLVAKVKDLQDSCPHPNGAKW